MEGVFIVGCPRSGTTLVQQYIASNFQVATLPETQYFSLLKPASLLGRMILPHAYLRARARKYLAWITKIPHDKLCDTSNDRDYFFDVMKSFSSEKGCDTWLEKTPRHLHFIDDISEERCKFIHVIRNGSSVTASLLKAYNENKQHWKPTFSLGLSQEKAVRRWNLDINISYGYVGYPNHYFIVYEDFLLNPQIADEVCKLLGLSQRLKTTKVDVVGKHEVWKVNNSKGIMKDKSECPQDFFTDKFNWDKYEKIRKVHQL